MIRFILLLLMVVPLFACTPEGRQAPTTVATESAAVATAQPLTGKQAYERACAECHDDGIDGAPGIGDREAWGGRSMLWQAVLFEHAKSGYLEMPPRGGDQILDDATISRAAEYMLSTTFPEIDKD
jgi:cytochrome c5